MSRFATLSQILSGQTYGPPAPPATAGGGEPFDAFPGDQAPPQYADAFPGDQAPPQYADAFPAVSPIEPAAPWQGSPAAAPAPASPPRYARLSELMQAAAPANVPGANPAAYSAPAVTNLAPDVDRFADADAADVPLMDRPGFYQNVFRLAGSVPEVTNLNGVPEQIERDEQDRAAGDLAYNNWRAAQDWIERREPLREGVAAGDPAAVRQFNQMNAQDPRPMEAISRLPLESRRLHDKAYHEEYAAPLLAATQAKREPGWNVAAHIATGRERVAAGLDDLQGQGRMALAGAYQQVTGSPALRAWGYRGADEAKARAEHARGEADYIDQQLPSTAAAEFVGGQADLAMKMGAAGIVGAVTKNPQAAAATFAGLFATDAAGHAMSEARQQGRSDKEATEDATFAGIKGGVIALLPMGWSRLAKETVATQMAGAYLSGTAITTGDAAADQAWRSAVRGEKVDAAAVERIGMAMLQGGLPAAGLHGLHAMANRPAAQPLPRGEVTSDYQPGPRRDYPAVDVGPLDGQPGADPATPTPGGLPPATVDRARAMLAKDAPADLQNGRPVDTTPAAIMPPADARPERQAQPPAPAPAPTAGRVFTQEETDALLASVGSKASPANTPKEFRGMATGMAGGTVDALYDRMWADVRGGKVDPKTAPLAEQVAARAYREGLIGSRNQMADVVREAEAAASAAPDGKRAEAVGNWYRQKFGQAQPSTAQQIAGTFDAMGEAAKAAGKAKTNETVDRQGYVDFQKPAAIEAFRRDNPDWQEEALPGAGGARFRRPIASPTPEAPAETNPAALKLERAGGSMQVVRTSEDPAGPFGSAGLNLRWNAKQGGYLVHPSQADAARNELDRLNRAPASDASAVSTSSAPSPSALTLEPHKGQSLIIRTPKDPAGPFGKGGLHLPYNNAEGGYIVAKPQQERARAAVAKVNRAAAGPATFADANARLRDAQAAVFGAGLGEAMDRPKQYGKYPPRKRALLEEYAAAKQDVERARGSASADELARDFEAKYGTAASTPAADKAPAKPVEGDAAKTADWIAGQGEGVLRKGIDHPPARDLAPAERPAADVDAPTYARTGDRAAEAARNNDLAGDPAAIADAARWLVDNGHAGETMKAAGERLAEQFGPNAKAAATRVWVEARRIAKGEAGETAKPATAAADVTAAHDPAAIPGKLDQLETWARKKLDEMGGTGLRSGLGGLPIDPVNDPKRFALYSVIAAAKIAKGAERFVTWSAKVVAEVPELAKATRAELLKIWAQARRITRMDEDGRADYLNDAFTQGGEERAKTTIRRLTGQIKDPAAAITALDALRLKLQAEAKGAASGYREGARDVTALGKELAAIVRDTLPPSLQRQFLGDVAKVRTPGQLRMALVKGKRLLADHAVRESLATLENLTGEMEVHVVRPPAPRKDATKAPKVLGDVDPAELKTVNLKTLPKDVRDEVNGLIEEARYLKDRLRNAAAGSSTEQKQRASAAFDAIDRQIRQVVANHIATRELRIGDRLVTRDKIASEIVDKLGTRDDAAPRTSAATGPRAESLKRLFGRQALSMDAIVTNMLGEDSDAYRLTIDQVRQGQSKFFGDQRRTHEAFTPALEAAGIPAGSKAFDDWLSDRVTVKLPDAGEFAMTRNEALDIVAMAGDPETRLLVNAGVPWSFEHHLRETPLDMTARDVATLEKMLKPGELALVDVFRRLNQEVTPAAMRAKIDLSGWAPEPHKGYFPRSRNRMQGEEAGLPEGWRGHLNRALENISSMKDRAMDRQQPLRVKGFISRVFDHFEDVARLVHLAEPVRSAAAVWQHPETAKAITRRYGESMNTRVAQYLADTMAVRTNPPPGIVGRAWERIARNVSRAWLAANPSPMAKNVLGGTASLLPEFELRDWSAGVRQMFSPDTYRRMLAGSGVAWSRYHGGLFGAYSPLAGGRSETVAELSFVEAIKAGKPGAAVDAIKLMSWADSVPLRAAWAASEAFIDRTRPGLPAAERTAAVAEKFEKAVYRTQNGTSSTEISGFASSARGNPMLSAFLLFKSDQAKRYSLLATLKNADNPTRAKAVAAVALNALAAAGVGYGLKQAASATGRKIGGADVDPDEQYAIKHASAWDAVRGVTSIAPLGGAVTDLARSIQTTGRSDVVGNPVEDVQAAFTDRLVNVGRSVGKWAEADGGSADAAKAYDALLAQTWKLSRAGSALGGVPLAPWMNYGERAYKAAHYQKPDPRLEAKHKTEEKMKNVRGDMPANVDRLLSEKAKLDKLPPGLRTDAERVRVQALGRVEGLYDAYRTHLRLGHKTGAARTFKEMEEEAAKR